MVKRSKGYRRASRSKLSKRVRERGVTPSSRVIQEFNPGDKVTILIDPSVVKGYPHPRYHGRVGKVVEKRGKAYVVEVRDGGLTKKIISRPEHLRRVQG